MAAIVGSDIAKMVLGYLKEEKLDKAMLEFSKSSPYLREEYSLMKRGLKPKQLTHFGLIELLKEYGEIDEIVTDFIENESNKSAGQGNLNFRSLTEKIQYICRITHKSGKTNRCKGIKTNATSKTKCPTVNPIEHDSDSSTLSSPQATQIHDLPGYFPPPKRRKLFNHNLVLQSGALNKSDAESVDADNEERSTTTPNKSTETIKSTEANKPIEAKTETSNPTSTRYLEMSTNKREIEPLTLSTGSTVKASTSLKHSSAVVAEASVPYEIFSETILDNPDFQNLLVENINSGVASSSATFDASKTNKMDGNVSLQEQLDQAMENIIMSTEKNPIFDLIVKEAVETASNQFWPENFDLETHSQLSSSTPNKSSENEDANVVMKSIEQYANDDGPSETIKQRLRPRKQANIITPTESTAGRSSKRKRDKEIEVISNEYVGTLAESAMQPHQDDNDGHSVILIKPDSMETTKITATQQIEYFPPSQPSGTFYVKLVDGSTMPFIITSAATNSNDDLMQLQQQQATAQLSMNNMNIPIIIDPTICTSSLFSSNGTMFDQGSILNTNELQQMQSPIFEQADSSQEQLNDGDNDHDSSQNRIIVLDSDDVEAEASQPTKSIKEADKEISKSQIKMEINPFLQFKSQLTEQKAGTPKQPIQTQIPNTSRSLSTPRHKISHVRVLDFTTPARANLNESIAALAAANRHESAANSSTMCRETPHNRSIASTVPNSAPPKINSMNESSAHTSKSPVVIYANESSSMDTVIPFSRDNDEDTVISVGSETPKVRKKHRTSCVRTLSTHKEVDAEEAQKRTKRLAKTKKKIIIEDDSSNEKTKTEQPIHADASNDPVNSINSKEDALREWQKIRSASNNGVLFEQNLREQNSKQQQQEIAGRSKRKTRGTRRRKEVALKAKENVKEKLCELEKNAQVVDVSMNSSIEIDADAANSSLLVFQAKMLEENLKSAKKCTPAKPMRKFKGKRKTPVQKMQIKLPKSPRVIAALKGEKKSKKSTTANEQSNDRNVEVTDSSLTSENTALVAEPRNTTVASQTEDSAIDASRNNEPNRPNTNDAVEVEVANNLLNMEEVILQREKEKIEHKLAESPSAEVMQRIEQLEISTQTSEQSSSYSGTSTTNVAVSKTVSEPTMPAKTYAEQSSKAQNLSMSALLETPLKLDATTMFPKTPGFTVPPQLVTPLFRPLSNPLDESMFKNHNFPTPTFPITPGAILTPFKDALSPKSDQETIFGAANRPTDYSSSSSYYKPDESDGVDKQLQAIIRATRNNSVYSSDEMECGDQLNSANISAQDQTYNHSQEENNAHCAQDESNSRLNSSSSSSSSSSSDSGSDSDSSDTSTTSSDTNKSKQSQKNRSEDFSEAVMKMDSEAAIKSHISSTNQAVVTHSTLLTVPQSPIPNKEAEKADNLAILNEKRLRVQERLRQKQPEKLAKASVTKKIRILAEARHEQLRGPQPLRSPSKRKLTQPQKVVSVTSQSQTFAPSTSIPESKVQPKDQIKKRSVETERLISEAANDNAVIDTFETAKRKITTEPKVATKAAAKENSTADEESIDAIESHIKLTKNTNELDLVNTPSAKDSSTINLSKDSLIKLLEDKRDQTLKKKKSPATIKTAKAIDALPMKKLTRSRSSGKSLLTNNVAKETTKTHGTRSKCQQALTAESKKIDKIVNEDQQSAQIVSQPNKLTHANKISTAQLEPALADPQHAGQTQSEKNVPSINMLSSADSMMPNILSTPLKTYRSERIREILGDVSDIETPMKSPSKQNTDKMGDTSISDNDDDDCGSDEDESDDETFDMVQFDERDKVHFHSVISRTTCTKVTPSTHSISFTFPPLDLDGKKIILKVEDEIELYKQEMNSIFPMQSVILKLPKKPDTPSLTDSEISSTSNLTRIVAKDKKSAEMKYEKPLQTSTPTVSKAQKQSSLVPKINIKHKDAKNPICVVKPTSKAKASINTTKSEQAHNLMDDMDINQVLKHLHPTSK